MLPEQLTMPEQLWNQHAEQSVIGGLMLDNTAFDLVAGKLSAADFYHRQHQLIFQAITATADLGKPFDIITLSEQLDRIGKLDAAGGLTYLASLAKDTPSAANVSSYADVVIDKSRRRQLMHVLSEGLHNMVGADLDKLSGDVMTRMEAITASGCSASLSFSEAFSRTLEFIDESSEAKRKGGTVGVPTGLPAIDARIGGLQKRRLIILAARPATGKTALGNQIALKAAIRGYPVGICSLEMGTEELTIRALANIYRLNASALAFGDEIELTKLSSAMAQRSIAALPIHIDTSTTTLGGIQARLSEWKRRHNIALGIVDHIGLIEGGDNKTRNDWLGTVSRTLKLTAKRLDMPILVVSQLSRLVEREKRRPVLADLRDSGNIEQDADVAMFLHVEPDAVPGANGMPMEIGLLKNRIGRSGWLSERLAFDGRTQTIREVV